jgi:hypothetical protein
MSKSPEICSPVLPHAVTIIFKLFHAHHLLSTYPQSRSLSPSIATLISFQLHVGIYLRDK